MNTLITSAQAKGFTPEQTANIVLEAYAVESLANIVAACFRAFVNDNTGNHVYIHAVHGELRLRELAQ